MEQTLNKVVGWRVGPFIESQYRQTLRDILNDQKQWDSFKRNQLLLAVWGQPSIPQFKGMYNELRSCPEVFLKLPEMARMDKVGGSWVYSLEGTSYSRNLIRYADSIRLINKYIGSLDGLKVLEFGSGFGGLAYCASQVWKLSSWGVVDLEEAQKVAIRHSHELGLEIATGGNVEDCDLFVAEWSLTEFVGAKLWEATEQYVMRAPQVFIRCNIVDPRIKEHWLEHLKTQFKVTVLREVPDTVKFNSIIVGTR